MNGLEKFIYHVFRNSTADNDKDIVFYHDIAKALTKDENLEYIFLLFDGLEKSNVVMQGTLGKYVKSLLEQKIITINGCFVALNGGIHLDTVPASPFYINGDPTDKSFIFVESVIHSPKILDKVDNFLQEKFKSNISLNCCLVDFLAVQLLGVHSHIQYAKSPLLQNEIESISFNNRYSLTSD